MTRRSPTPSCEAGSRLAALAIAAFAFLLPAVSGAAMLAGADLVETRAGTVQGVAALDMIVFRGLRYAAAPVGDRSWKAPQALEGWAGLRRADAFGPACPQDRTVSVDQAGDPGPTSEDCLFLNVWTPRADVQTRAPVMVWLHGGAFVIGAGSQSMYDGSALARHGVVVVTLNYRLGPLGFFSHPALDRECARSPANFGLLDQIAALRWVQANIAAFGGDPGNVTVFGESAGAQSMLALFATPRAQGLFARGIAQSPYGVPSPSRDQASGGPAWPRNGRRNRQILEFADEPVVRSDFLQKRLDAFIAALNLAGLFAGR